MREVGLRIKIILCMCLVVTALLSWHEPKNSFAEETRGIMFPVEGSSRYSNDFGDSRSGGRTHEGIDIFGTKMQKLRAAVDGTVTYLKVDAGGSSGNMLTITDAEGWQYRYLHLNNDRPGTDDASNLPQLIVIPGLRQGSRILRAQHIGYLGDSGNAESTAPHLHFEIRRPDGSPINPYFSLGSAPRERAPVARGIAANPNGGYYVLAGDGIVHPYGGAPWLGSPQWDWDIARAIAVMPDGNGYVLLDGWGGLHKYGSAGVGDMAKITGPYWHGWDIARALAITPSGNGIAVLDGWGGVHSSGDAPTYSGAYWAGWDIARSLAITSSGKGVYVLDALGGVHGSGDALPQATPYWNWEIARAIVAAPVGRGYAVLDGWGGVHSAGAAPLALSSGWMSGYDHWIGLSVRGGRYYAIRDDGLSEVW